MLIELHCHSAEHSPCSRLAAAEAARQCLARGLDGLALTDHHYRWSDEELAALRSAASLPEHFLLASGQEVSTADSGHVLVFGDVPAIAHGATVAEIRARHPQVAIVRAHPFRQGTAGDGAVLPGAGCDAVEILSANHPVVGNVRGVESWHRLRFTAVAGTDAHGQVAAGTYPTQFDHPVGSIAELAEEIRRGRCRPLIKEITLAGPGGRVTEIVVGAKGAVRERPRVLLRHFDAPGPWRRAVGTARLMREIATRGFGSGRYRLPTAIESDREGLTVIEEGLRGRTLHDRLVDAGPEEGRAYLRLAAQWLARLHALDPPPRASAGFLEREGRRIPRYADRFRDAGLPRAELVRELGAAILRETRRVAATPAAHPVLCHGDFHPKNIVIGQDNPEDRDTLFVAAVDFEYAALAPAAFDVGWFLAHHRHQLAGHPAVLAAWPPEDFLADYHAASAVELTPDFDEQVELFTARADMSIAAYLVKLGLGDGPEVGRLLAEAWQRVGHRPADTPWDGASVVAPGTAAG